MGVAVHLALAGMAAGLFVGHSSAQAAALGGAEPRSSLNQPLRVRIAVTLRDGEELAPNCVRAIAPQRDDLPLVFGARATLQRDERGPYVLYTSSGPITEPAVRGAVEVGCSDPVVREFVVLLDPLPVNPPAVVPTPPAIGAVQPQPAVPAARVTPATPAAAPTRAARPTPPRASAATQADRAAATQPRKPTRNRAQPKASVPAVSDRLTLAPAGSGTSGLLGGDAGLKLSELLSRLPQGGDAPADAEVARKLAIEQARLVAILRDEDPLAAAQIKERELNERLNAMNRDLTAVRAQVAELAQRNRELERFAWMQWFGWLLAGLVVLATAFFAVRAVRNLVAARRKPKEDPWWTATQAAAMRPATVYADNPYHDTIKPAPAPAPLRAGPSESTTTFESPPNPADHRIEVRELERTSTTFLREFEKSPETQVETFATTIPQPTEFQRLAQPTRFAPTKPAVSLVQPRGPFPDTTADPAVKSMPPLDFDLNLPPLDLDVSPPETPSEPAADDAPADGAKAPSASSKPPAKP
jgi:hypothetical protein